ncbi:MAG: hypothetical protein Q9191_008471, partial [Dirinaria sp. TL-2023a]
LIAAVHISDPGASLESDDDSDSEMLSSSENDILRLCRNLVVLDAERQVFRFAHQSVREYLLQKSEYSLLEQHTFAAERCLDVYVTRHSSDAALRSMNQANNVFKAYAELFWPLHYKYVDDDNYQKLKEKLSSFTDNFSKAPAPYLGWISDIQSNPKYRPTWATSSWTLQDLDFHVSKKVENRIGAAISKPETYLSVACAFGLSRFLEECISSSIDWKTRRLLDPTNGRFLHMAVEEGHEKIVQLLLDHGANVNAISKFGGTALHVASVRGFEKIVQLLLNHGANVNAISKYDDTALHVASLRGFEKIVQLLLDHGANVNAISKYDDTALHVASEKGFEKIVQLLLDHSADVNAISKFDDTALHAASEKGFEKIVQLLLDHGANVNAANTDHKTALQLASREGNEKIVQLLLDHGAASKAEDLSRALQLASEYGHEKLIHLLILKLLLLRAPAFGRKRRLSRYEMELNPNPLLRL